MTQSITFELPTDIAYVAGTVNDVETVFVQDEAYPIRWRATVDVDPDNLYRIYLEMYDEAGNKSEYNNTIEYILPQFVYDRTAEDVAYVNELRMIGWQNLTDEQKQEWLGGLKGAFNLSDVKRTRIIVLYWHNFSMFHWLLIGITCQSILIENTLRICGKMCRH